jgi:hypothetical protein
MFQIGFLGRLNNANIKVERPSIGAAMPLPNQIMNRMLRSPGLI